MEFWKNGLLPFDAAKITINYVVEDETEHPDFEHIMLILITVTFDIHHITWPGRKNHYKVRTRKLKWGNLVLFLCSSTNLNSGASSSSVNPNPICIICDEHDAIENLHAAGVFHASKSKLNML